MGGRSVMEMIRALMEGYEVATCFVGGVRIALNDS